MIGSDIAVTGVSARTRNKARAVPIDAYDWYDDPVALAEAPGTDVFVELMGGAEGPAREAVTAALKAGKSVATANKALIAAHGEELARLTGMMLVVDGLLRRKSTPFLGNLDRRSRSSALSGAITVNPSRRDMIKGANVVLVDDVLTSGATSNACVSALKRRGANSVLIACYARVLDEVF